LYAQTANIDAKADSKQTVACVVPHGRDALLKLMQCCSRDLKSDRDCREYDAVNRYVIIKDDAPTKPQAYLLIPSIKVTGIDDKRIFAAPYVNLWANAWDQSERYPGWGERRIGMAINSAHARTQDQLHVHISCIDPKVAQVLDDHAKEPDGIKPYTVQLPPANNNYDVTVVNDLTDGESPFWVAKKAAKTGERMADKSVAVVKAKEPGRYYILTTVYKDGKGGAAEELLDQTCGTGN
jgi:CDP-diacylglycerol pyrophosphatase